jgi:hypothetical protein
VILICQYTTYALRQQFPEFPSLLILSRIRRPPPAQLYSKENPSTRRTIQEVRGLPTNYIHCRRQSIRIYIERPECDGNGAANLSSDCPSQEATSRARASPPNLPYRESMITIRSPRRGPLRKRLHGQSTIIDTSNCFSYIFCYRIEDPKKSILTAHPFSHLKRFQCL